MIEIPFQNTDPKYDRLVAVLQKAYDQAATGKGKERHANGLPYDKQPMQSISHLLRSENGMAYQAIKKLTEGLNLPTHERRVAELLGAINYIAGIVIYLEDSEGGAPASPAEKAEQKLFVPMEKPAKLRVRLMPHEQIKRGDRVAYRNDGLLHRATLEDKAMHYYVAAEDLHGSIADAVNGHLFNPAPEEALIWRYEATDADGCLFAFTDRPTFRNGLWYENGGHKRFIRVQKLPSPDAAQFSLSVLSVASGDQLEGVRA